MYVIYECSAEGCTGSSGIAVRAVDAAGFERWHGCFDDRRTHTLRKVGESEVDPTAHLSTQSERR